MPTKSPIRSRRKTAASDSSPRLLDSDDGLIGMTAEDIRAALERACASRRLLEARHTASTQILARELRHSEQAAAVAALQLDEAAATATTALDAASAAAATSIASAEACTAASESRGAVERRLLVHELAVSEVSCIRTRLPCTLH